MRNFAKGASMHALPIDAVLPAIRNALDAGSRLVLAAPPGAGKTTRIPLELIGERWLSGGRILILEPRRIAARMAAERMAASIGEKPGETIGLSTRIDKMVSSRTRIEVITDGLFTRRILSDPELSGVGAVLFDEFHERSLNVDLGLALALDAQDGLRPDLRLVVMSATLDTARVAGAIGAPVIESAGRAFPVETRYLGRSDDRLEDSASRAVRRALRERSGSILVFLPGMVKSGAPPNGWKMRRAIRLSRLYSARCPRRNRISPSRPHQRENAKSFWRPTSPKVR
ncbi:MAG: DEAD/DEAH box helicase [Parvularculaceae bacterium]